MTTHRQPRKIGELVQPDELAKTITQEINQSASGLRGRKRREYLKLARQWWMAMIKGETPPK